MSGAKLFATGTPFEALEVVAEASRDVWFSGAVGETMYIEPWLTKSWAQPGNVLEGGPRWVLRPLVGTGG